MIQVTLVVEMELRQDTWPVVHSYLTNVFDRLFELEETDPPLCDADLSVHLAEGRAEISVSVLTTDTGEALGIAADAIKRAVGSIESGAQDTEARPSM